MLEALNPLASLAVWSAVRVERTLESLPASLPRPMRRHRQRYESRLGHATIHTGRLDEIGEFQVGDRLEVAGSAGIIRAVDDDGGREPKLILELLPHGA